MHKILVVPFNFHKMGFILPDFAFFDKNLSDKQEKIFPTIQKLQRQQPTLPSCHNVTVYTVHVHFFHAGVLEII